MDWLAPLKELIGFASPLLESVSAIRVILGFILVFFLPGFAWTMLFSRQISILERVLLSLPMSIAIVTIGLLIMNFILKVPLSGLNSLIAILFITILPLPFLYLNKLIKRRRENTFPESEPGV